MSINLKKAAKAIRGRYGLSAGVRPAKKGERCRSQNPAEGHTEQAWVVEAGVGGLCHPCMKQAHKRRRR